MFTWALHWSISWARLIQSIPSQRIYVRSILVLSYLRWGLPSGLLSGFSTKILYAVSFPPYMLHALLISSSLSSSFYLNLVKSYKLWSSSLHNILHPVTMSTPLSPYIHSNLFWNTVSLCSSLPLMSETRFYTHTCHTVIKGFCLLRNKILSTVWNESSHNSLWYSLKVKLSLFLSN
jgi:hypothetical protein